MAPETVEAEEFRGNTQNIATSDPAFCKTDDLLEIKKMVATIKATPSGMQRYLLAERMAISIGQADTSYVTDDEIDAIISLLDDKDRFVKMFAASALGEIGPKAKKAVPVIEKELRELKEKSAKGPESAPYSGVSADDVINYALQRINGLRPLTKACPS